MPNKLIRNFITGEWEEVPFTGSGVIARITAPGAVERTYHTGTNWPYASNAAATDPENIPKEKEILKRHGVKTDYTPTGEPIFRSPAHRKAHCEVFGLYDRNGGHGDPMPRNYVASNYTREAKLAAIMRAMDGVGYD